MTTAMTRRAGLFAAAGAGVILLAFAVMIWQQLLNVQQARQWVRHTYEVLVTTKDLKVALRDIEMDQRGFLLTGKGDYLAAYNEALDQVTLFQGDLRRLTSDNPAQQDRLRLLGGIIQRKVGELAKTIQLRQDLGPDSALRVVDSDRGQRLTVDVEEVLNNVIAEEQHLLVARTAEADRKAWHSRWLALGGLGVAAGFVALAGRQLMAARNKLARAEAEQHALADQLQTSLNSISQGVGVFSPDRRLRRCNHCFPILLALPEALTREDTPYAAIASTVQSVAGGDVLETEEQIRHGRDGRAQDAPVVYERKRHSDGRSIEIRRTAMPDAGFVITVSDITERVRDEETRRDRERMAAMGQLTGGIAHDFNNLLAVILGNLELAKPKIQADSPVLPRLERAIWGAKRGSSLIQQLLAFARRQPLVPTPLDLSAMLPGMTDMLRRTLGEHIEVQVVGTAGLWPAMADAAQIESALLNLALNARDAMQGGGRLTIEVANKVIDVSYAARHAEVKPGDYVMLAVSDTGTGMPPEVLARVFEPFFTTKPSGEGTGLGLAMVFGFAKQSGGHVNIYSEPGEGTTVRLYLPRAVGAALRSEQRPSAPLDLPRGSATILVIEDEPAVREITGTILQDLGYRVLEASDGSEALRVFGERGAKIDLLLADVVLPGGMKGHEVAKRISAVRPEIKTLFMSGYTENAIVHHGRLDDGVQLLSKPFSREQLARKVAEVILGAASASAPSSDGKVISMQRESPSAK